jgi:hypothetical protein
MKKQILILIVLVFGTLSLSAQVSQGDIQLVQKYFGAEKIALVKDYMKLNPHQDSAFWPIYNRYETERQAYGAERIGLVDGYLKNIKDITEEKATQMVDKGVAMEIKFKNLQKKYFSEMSKKIGPVKAAQFYQLENYINNVINLSIQENIPFVGELEQKHATMTKKK